MYTKKKYSIFDMVFWTRQETVIFLLLALITAVLYQVAGLTWLRLPWTPIALIGTAVAFLIGFQNNAAYGRAWEARQIWGGIVNESRTWAIWVRDMVVDERADAFATEEELQEIRRELVLRHVAWLTTLRYSMRQSRPWEVFNQHRTNRSWYEQLCIPERDFPLEGELATLLPADEIQSVLAKTNKPAAILTRQSQRLRELKQEGLVWEFSFLELEGLIRDLLTLQGKSERIKNFPYPRQYATLSHDIVRVFVVLLPLGVIPEFADIGREIAASFPLAGRYFVWAGVPFSVIVSWVFHTMQRIGTSGENPFEGSANDVPISTMSRGIEIDMREIIDSAPETIPQPLPSVLGIQM